MVHRDDRARHLPGQHSDFRGPRISGRRGNRTSTRTEQRWRMSYGCRNSEGGEHTPVGGNLPHIAVTSFLENVSGSLALCISMKAGKESRAHIEREEHDKPRPIRSEARQSGNDRGDRSTF